MLYLRRGYKFFWNVFLMRMTNFYNGRPFTAKSYYESKSRLDDKQNTQLTVNVQDPTTCGQNPARRRVNLYLYGQFRGRHE